MAGLRRKEGEGRPEEIRREKARSALFYYSALLYSVNLILPYTLLYSDLS